MDDSLEPVQNAEEDILKEVNCPEEETDSRTPCEILEEEYKELETEREQFQSERKRFGRQMEAEKKQLQKERDFLNQKMAILKGGFVQLETDRKKLEKEQYHFEAEKDVMKQMTEKTLYEDMSGIFFSGVTNLLTLKKRYKDLIKIFHPDNVCGDTDTIQMINKEYERLKQEFSCFRKTGSGGDW